MGLESATYLSGLNAANPEGTDFKSQGDDHLRLIKSTLQATFPNASKPFRFPASLGVQTANYTVLAATGDNLVVPVDVSSGGLSVTLPASVPYDGFRVIVVKVDPSHNSVTVLGNGNAINAGTSYQLSSMYRPLELVWSAVMSRWLAQGPEESGFPVGALMPYAGSAILPTGWVRANGRTLGNALSGATERASADTVALFVHLYNNFSNSLAPVSGGRGANALADYALNKTITLPDLRGRSFFGLDAMGGSSAGRLSSALSGVDGTLLGASGGLQAATILRTELPNQTLQVAGTTSLAGAKNTNVFWVEGGSEGGSADRLTALSASSGSDAITLTTANNHAHSFNVQSESLNGGVTQTVRSNMPPAFVGTWLVKL